LILCIVALAAVCAIRLKPLDFSGKKILSMPSFGKEVKPFAPCSKFAARQRTLYLTVEVANYRLTEVSGVA
jgi:hypothetical protein